MKLGLLLTINRHLKKENSFAWLDYAVPEIFAGVHFGYWRSKFRSHSFLIHVCFLLFCKCLSKECCLNKVIFPATVVKILHYIQHAFSFWLQPVRNMTVTTIELLYYQDCFANVLRHLIEVYQYVILSLRTWPVSFEPTKTKTLMLALLSYVQQNSPTFDTNSYNVNKNDVVKEDAEDFYEFHFSLLF